MVGLCATTPADFLSYRLQVQAQLAHSVHPLIRFPSRASRRQCYSESEVIHSCASCRTYALFGPSRTGEPVSRTSRVRFSGAGQATAVQTSKVTHCLLCWVGLRSSQLSYRHGPPWMRLDSQSSSGTDIPAKGAGFAGTAGSIWINFGKRPCNGRLSRVCLSFSFGPEVPSAVTINCCHDDVRMWNSMTRPVLMLMLVLMLLFMSRQCVPCDLPQAPSSQTQWHLQKRCGVVCSACCTCTWTRLTQLLPFLLVHTYLVLSCDPRHI